MTSAHRYPPPPPNSQNDFRLPSLKDLNFYRPSGAQPALPPSQQQEPGNLQPDQAPHPTRHPGNWSRSAYQPAQLATPAAHQQYTPAGHEVSPKVEYTPKHENNGYAHPGVPLSIQANLVPNSASMVPPRNEDASHSPNQPKRQRTAPSAASRDTRAPHPSVYPHPQYTSYPQGSQPPSASQYHSVAPGLPPTPSHATHPAPSSHEQVHHHSHPMQVTAHPGYAYPAYVQPRQTLLHPPNSPQVSQHNHSNPYPPSAPPPPPAHAPQPQGPWVQSHSQQPPTHFQQQPPPQPPPPSQHPQHNTHPVHAPSHHHQHQHQASMPASSNQPVQAHHHQQQPPPPGPPANPQPSQQIPPPVQYHPHQQQYQNPYPHPSQPQQQQAPASFVRPTAINPNNLENRSTYPVAEPPRVSSVQNDAMSEITDHCNILYSFANQYVNLQQSNPNAQPLPAELEEMSQRALKVVRLLDDFRRICIPESTQLQNSPTGSVLALTSVAPMETDSPGPGESSRPPKRPWEDSQEDGVPPSDAVGFQDQFPANPSPEPRNPSTAEQDMELIRTKRATSTAMANGSTGQPKSKYRKRSMGQRASPPGKCTSCNIRETPEWRRGPDGARTLCNACGLHYAKLMRKQNKTTGNGDLPQIDLETLRASTRAADIAEKGRNASSKQAESSTSTSSKANNKIQQNLSEANTPGTTTPAPSQTHQGSFQLVNMMAPPQEHHATQNHAHGHPPNPSSSSATVPTPMPVDSRATSQHASTPQMHAPPLPSSTPSQHPHPHPLHPPHPPWPTTAATTGPAAAASGAVSASSTAPVRGGAPGGSVNGSSFGNPPSQSPVDFIRRQYSLPTRISNQQHQPVSR